MAADRAHERGNELFRRASRTMPVVDRDHPAFKRKGMDPPTKEKRDEALKLLSKADEAYTEAIRLNPEDPNFYVDRARCSSMRTRNIIIYLEETPMSGDPYGKMDDYDQALLDLEECFKRDPNNIEAFFERAKIYSYLKLYEMALDDYCKVLDMDEDREDAVEGYRETLHVMWRFSPATRLRGLSNPYVKRELHRPEILAAFQLMRDHPPRGREKLLEDSAEIMRSIEILTQGGMWKFR